MGINGFYQRVAFHFVSGLGSVANLMRIFKLTLRKNEVDWALTVSIKESPSTSFQA